MSALYWEVCTCARATVKHGPSAQTCPCISATFQSFHWTQEGPFVFLQCTQTSFLTWPCEGLTGIKARPHMLQHPHMLSRFTDLQPSIHRLSKYIALNTHRCHLPSQIHSAQHPHMSSCSAFNCLTRVLALVLSPSACIGNEAIQR
eukprot:1145672-Pelagomonas_calceolata.AAC.4